MAKAKCVECEADVPVDGDIVVGEIVPCPDCGTELEILSLDPLSIDRAPEVQEDWGE